MKRFLSLAFFSSLFILNSFKGFSSEFYEPFELKAFNRPISYLIDESIECYHGKGDENGVLSLNFQNNKGMIALIDVSKGYKINIIREKHL